MTATGARRAGRNPMKHTLVLIAVLISLAPGCSAPRSVGEYLGDRARDLTDCFRLSLGYGWGLHVRLHPVILPPAGLGAAAGTKYGWDGPAGAGAFRWEEMSASLFLFPFAWIDMDTRSPDMAALKKALALRSPPPEDARAVVQVMMHGFLIPRAVEQRGYRRIIPSGTQAADRSWLGIDATAIVPSARAGVNPAELIDFALGFLGLDILGDDHWVAETDDARDILAAARDGDLEKTRALLAGDSRLVYARNRAHQTPLYVAAERGHLDAANALLAQGAHVDARDLAGLTPLHAAARGGNPKLFDAVLAHGAELDTPGLPGQAAAGGSVEIVSCIVSHAQPDQLADALRAAVRHGHIPVVERLMDHGLSLSIKSEPYDMGFTEGTLLHTAAAAGRKDMVAFLLAKGLDVNARDRHVETQLEKDLHSKSPRKIKAALDRLRYEAARKGRNGGYWSHRLTNRIYQHDQTPLHRAAAAGHAGVVTLLLDKGADVNAKNNRQCTALFFAARGPHQPMAAALLARGADPNVSGLSGYTPLHLAVLQGATDLVRTLLEHGANPSLKEKRLGRTPLHFAAHSALFEIVDLLIQADSDLDAKDHRDQTPLLVAMLRSENARIVKRLLDGGADPNREGPRGTPLQLAVTRGDHDITAALLKNKANVAVTDETGRTPLHVAARHGDKVLVRLLLAHGADAAARSKQGHTPLDEAREADRTEIIGLLEKSGRKP